MEENKNETVENNEVATTANEEKTEEVKAEVVTEKKYNQENLTKSIILAAAILIVFFTHKIFEWAGLTGNLPWLIINIICVAAGAVVIVLSALFFAKVTMKNLKNDIPSFCVSLAALVYASIWTLVWSIDTINNLIGFINDLA